MSEKEIVLKIAAKYLNQDQMKKLNEDLKGVEQRTQSWFEVMKGILAANIIQNIARQAIAFGKSCVTAFLESEVAVNRLSVALKNNGTYTKGLQAEYVRFSKEMQAASTSTDEEVLSIMALLSSLGIMGHNLETATKATMDFATTQKIDSMTAAMLLGKAYQGNTDTLARYGIQIEKTGDTAKDFDRVLAAINKRSGGSAAAELNTFAGQWKNLKNVFEEMQEGIGSKLVPYMEKLVGFIKYAAEWYGVIIKKKEDLKYLTDEEYKKGLDLQKQHGATSKIVIDYLTKMRALSAERKQAAEAELAAADALAERLKINNDLLKQSRETGISMGQAYSDAFTSAQRAGESFGDSLSAGLEAAGISALKIFKKYLIDMLTGWYQEQLAQQTIEAITTKGATAWKIAQSSAVFAGGIVAINAAIPYAKGGIITQPTLALMGEAGPEMVVPLSGSNASEFQNNMGSVTVHVNAGVFVGNKVTAMETAKVIGDLLMKAKAKGVIGKI